MILRSYLSFTISTAAQHSSAGLASRKWLSTLSRVQVGVYNGSGFVNREKAFTLRTRSIKPCVQPENILLITSRNTGFLTKISGKDLWGGVTGVSGAGKKRGRGKRVGRKKVVDLNRGQMIGTGQANMLWPGLNAPVFEGSRKLEHKQLPPNPEYQADLARIREQMSRISYRSNPPLLRGWSGKKMPGQSMGKPDAIGDYSFEGFDSRVLSYRLVSNMTGTLGRKLRFSAFVVVGNRNGLAGYGIGKAQNGQTALKMARNRAAQHLMYIPRYQDHTVYHNMYTQFHKSKIFIHKKEKGYGLRCHRAIRTICELMGVQDLHCNVEGSTKNIPAVTKALFNALIHQETHQELSDRLKYHIVEMRPERENYPVVVASPQAGEVQSKEFMNETEDLQGNFDRLYYGGMVEYEGKRNKPPPYHTLKSYKKKLAFLHRDRNQEKAKILRRAGLW